MVDMFGQEPVFGGPELPKEKQVQHPQTQMQYIEGLRKKRELFSQKKNADLGSIKQKLKGMGTLNWPTTINSQIAESLATRLEEAARAGDSDSILNISVEMDKMGLFQGRQSLIDAVNGLHRSTEGAKQTNKELYATPPQEEVAREVLADIELRKERLKEEEKGNIVVSERGKRERAALEKEQANILKTLNSPQSRKDALDRSMQKMSEGEVFEDQSGDVINRTNQGNNDIQSTLEGIAQTNDPVGGITSALENRYGDVSMEEVKKRADAMSEMFGIDIIRSNAKQAVAAIQKSIDEAQSRGFLPRFLEAFALVFGGQDVRSAMGIMQAQKDAVLQMQLNQIDILNQAEAQVAAKREELFNTALNWTLREERMAIDEAQIEAQGTPSLSKMRYNIDKLKDDFIENPESLQMSEGADEIVDSYQAFADSGFKAEAMPVAMVELYRRLKSMIKDKLTEENDGVAPSKEELHTAIMDEVKITAMRSMQALGVDFEQGE